MTDLAGKVALVTGASSGIGRAIASGLAAQGMALGLVGRNSERLRAVADQISLKAQKVVTYPLDLTSPGAVGELLEQVNRDFGRLHILVHSAGAFARGAVGSASVADLDWQYQVNVRVPYAVTQALLPLLKSSQGDVVFINSSAGLAARGEVSQYAATKHALKAVADSLREEVNADGVRVMNLFVGRTATPMQEEVHRMERRPYKPERLLHAEDIAAMVVSAVSLPNTAEVTDISIRPHLKLS
jgi:NADP-dependent 3-hydroxy acid dehydrogenase YdfG